MTEVVLSSSGAPAAGLAWNDINWKQVKSQVNRLQMRIAKAFREGKCGKAKSLQWILTHSFSAKLLAVKRVTSNQGAKTPGVDGKVWRTPNQKMQAAVSLKRHGYQAQPLRRHVKIKADATPFDPAYEKYFRIRQLRRKEKRLFFPCKSQWSPWWELQPDDS